MDKFKKFVAGEQSNISKALQDVIAKMPHSVQEIASYALLSGGKRLRPVLTLLWYHLIKEHRKTQPENEICEAFSIPCTNPKAGGISAVSKEITHENLNIHDASIVLEMFHVASLLHDDVLDDADLRRGKTSAHIKFGIRPCLLAGDALLAMGNKQMAEFGNVDLMNIISDALLKTANGEIEEIALAGNIPATDKEYLSVIEGKTAWIIRSACDVGAVMAGANEEERQCARDFGLNLGMAFQIVDDALDFSSEEIIGKPAGGDLRERKCTPPIYMYLQSLNEEERADFTQKFSVLPDPVFGQTRDSQEKGFTDEELQDITQKIIQNGYPEKTKDLALEYLGNAVNAVKPFSGEYASMLLEAVAYVQAREK